MSKGFATNNLASKKLKKKVISNEPQGRLISWSPWPPANFQTRYPAFPYVLTILIIVIGQWYLSLLRGSDRLWEDEIPSKIVNAAWRVQASKFLRNRVEAFLIVFFIGFLMVLDQISANLRMIPSNVLENLAKSNNFISDLLLKLPLLQVGQFAIPLIGFSLMALLLQALLPSRKVPLKPLLPGSLHIGIGLPTLTLAVSKSILSLGVRFQAYGFIGGFLVLTLWVWLLGVILYFGQCWSVVLASMTLLNK